MLLWQIPCSALRKKNSVCISELYLPHRQIRSPKDKLCSSTYWLPKKTTTYNSRIAAGNFELLEAKQPRSSACLSTIRINVGREEHEVYVPVRTQQQCTRMIYSCSNPAALPVTHTWDQHGVKYYRGRNMLIS